MKKIAKLRRYCREDIEYLTNVAVREVPKLPNYEGVTPDASRIKFLLENNITNDGQFICYVLEAPDGLIVGGIAAYCVPLTFSWDTATGDIFLFILPEWRNLYNAAKLVTAYREWGKARGAKLIQATHTGGTHDQGMERFLGSLGFQPVGKLYHYRSE